MVYLETDNEKDKQSFGDRGGGECYIKGLGIPEGNK